MLRWMLNGANWTLNVAVQVKIWFQNRRSKYKKLLKQFGLGAGRVPGGGGGAVMESTVTSDLPDCATPAAAAATAATAAALQLDPARIKSSPQSFDDGAEQSAVAATSTTTDELSSLDLHHQQHGGAPGTCWAPRDSYLAAAAGSYDFTAGSSAALYAAHTQPDLVAALAPPSRTSTCYQPWCLAAEHCPHHLFT